MKLTLIDKDMLRTAIAGNTDASEKDAAHIINTVLLKQRRHHGVSASATAMPATCAKGCTPKSATT